MNRNAKRPTVRLEGFPHGIVLFNEWRTIKYRTVKSSGIFVHFQLFHFIFKTNEI